MIELIKKIISENKDIHAYKIIESRDESKELFLIKKDVDMTREKNVHYYSVVVYSDFEEDGKKYRGSTPIRIHPSMSEEEVSKLINDGAFAATFVKNEYYPLPLKSEVTESLPRSSFESKDFSLLIDEIASSLYKFDTFDKGGMNSCEIFLNKKSLRLINSEGVDISKDSYNGMTEFITTWKEDSESEEVELYKSFNFSGFDPEIFATRAKDMIIQCKGKAIASPTPQLADIPVILNNESVKDFFEFYIDLSHAGGIYQGFSNWKTETSVQGENIQGDKVSINLDPLMKDSSRSSLFDGDGYPLKKVSLIEDGVLMRYHGDLRNSHYLKVEPTGNISNYEVLGGSKKIEELKSEPHLEIAAFSDFSLDALTGNFGGEIRLAWYFDGAKTVPVSGGSITGNMNNVQENMYLSSELQQLDNFIGPSLIKLSGVKITGIK